MKVEANNPKFNFLRHNDDPYRPYYKQKLDEFMAAPGDTSVSAQSATETATAKYAPEALAPGISAPRGENPYQK